MTLKEFEIQYALGSLSNEYIISISNNKSTSKRVLTILSKDKNVRWNVAGNPNTPKEILINLSTDEDRHARSIVAENTNTPTEILVNLSTDKDVWVRYYVADNPNTPKEHNDYKRI